MKFFLFSLVVISIVLVLIPHLLYLLMKIAVLVLPINVKYKPFAVSAFVLVAVWVTLAIYGRVWGRFFHEVKQVELSFPTIPSAFDGYRIIHLSDLHLDGWEGHTQQLQTIVDEVNALNPDLIVFTGDLVSLNEKELEPFVPVLRQFKARDGVFSILGNHDYQPYNRSWSDSQRAEHVAHLVDMERQQLGWHLLMNENAIVHRGADSIAILGSENQSLGIHNVVVRGNLSETMQGTDGLFRILLTHDPTHWRGEVLGKTDIPLTLSGHTHSGQVRICGFSVARFVYREYDGHYEVNHQHLYVNIGLGGTMPMRLGATPEITILTLKK